jgi:hypothetical protein
VAIRDGRTSSEFVRRRAYTDEFQELAFHPEEEESHEELAVIDKTGRLQIPKEYLEAAGLLGKKTGRVELDGNRIIIVDASAGDASVGDAAAGDIANDDDKTDGEGPAADQN